MAEREKIAAIQLRICISQVLDPLIQFLSQHTLTAPFTKKRSFLN